MSMRARKDEALIDDGGLAPKKNTSVTRAKSALKTQIRRYTTPGFRQRLLSVIRILSPAVVATRNVRAVQRARRNLLNLGFIERATIDLIEWTQDRRRPNRQKLAAWEMGLWHLMHAPDLDPAKALHYFEITGREELDPDWRRRVAVAAAEAHRQLGQREEALAVLTKKPVVQRHPDVFLARASLAEDIPAKLVAINKALAISRLTPVSALQQGATPYDHLSASAPPLHAHKNGSPLELITVIMPAYNAEATISTAIRSILAQSWTALELIVVDDASTDDTATIVTSFAEADSRIRLVRANKNGGPYIARNLALREARGEFITCNDADDWSHPQKLALQAKDLHAHPDVVANTSEQARLSEDLVFDLRGNPGVYTFQNLSSLMFRREPVVERVGYWDSVRFGADGEFMRRVSLAFGDKKINRLKTGPTSFQRCTSGSLTGDDYFGYYGYLYGVRQEYFDSLSFYHAKGESLRLEFPQKRRPYPVPAPLRPDWDSANQKHYDVIIASDFRLEGGSTLSSVEEVKAQSAAGLKTGIVQLNRYDFDPLRKLNPRARELFELPNVQAVVYGEHVSTDLLLVRYPPVLQEYQRYVPTIDAEHVKVIINQPPMSDYGPERKLRYEIPRCAENLKRMIGRAGVWHPIGPAVREALHVHHSEDLPHITLSEEDWSNIIDIADWRRPTRTPSARPRIGRHARDHPVKWPETRETLLACYPDSDKYEVSILGGAEHAKSVLGGLPQNWRVYGFNEIGVQDYLEQLDVFVYFTHSDWVESFGRVVIEAMAAGVPVVLPHGYRRLFADAAVYATPETVTLEVDRLIGDPTLYAAHAAKAIEFVRSRFSYEAHISRLHTLMATTTESASR